MAQQEADWSMPWLMGHVPAPGGCGLGLCDDRQILNARGRPEELGNLVELMSAVRSDVVLVTDFTAGNFRDSGVVGFADPRLGKMILALEATSSTWLHEFGHLQGLMHYGELDQTAARPNRWRLGECLDGNPCLRWNTDPALVGNRLMAGGVPGDRNWFDTSCRDCEYLRAKFEPLVKSPPQPTEGIDPWSPV